MKKATKNGIDHIITVTNKDNERQVEMMVGKAMCAYANWQERKSNMEELAEHFGIAQVRMCMTASQSEYEATVRCIAMFVDQPTSYICQYVVVRCHEELGI